MPTLDGYLHADTPHASTVQPAGYRYGCHSAERGGTGPRGGQTRHIAKDALRHYLKPACGTCKGLGMLGVERDLPPEQRGRIRPCDACGGSGKEPLPRRYQRELRAVLAVMEHQRHNAGAGVRRKCSCGLMSNSCCILFD